MSDSFKMQALRMRVEPTAVRLSLKSGNLKIAPAICRTVVQDTPTAAEQLDNADSRHANMEQPA